LSAQDDVGTTWIIEVNDYKEGGGQWQLHWSCIFIIYMMLRNAIYQEQSMLQT
jgi:hypothetical protein